MVFSLFVLFLLEPIYFIKLWNFYLFVCVEKKGEKNREVRQNKQLLLYNKISTFGAFLNIAKWTKIFTKYSKILHLSSIGTDRLLSMSTCDRH